jgi:hypothetical protein
MPPQPSDTKSSPDWLDLNLPIPERPLPTLPELPLQTLFALCEQLAASTVKDDAYFAISLASKNPAPFVL